MDQCSKFWSTYRAASLIQTTQHLKISLDVCLAPCREKPKQKKHTHMWSAIFQAHDSDLDLYIIVLFSFHFKVVLYCCLATKGHFFLQFFFTFHIDKNSEVNQSPCVLKRKNAVLKSICHASCEKNNESIQSNVKRSILLFFNFFSCCYSIKHLVSLYI